MAGLDDWRVRIDELDERLIHLLAARFDAVREVARYKQSEGVAMLQPAREAVVRDRYRAGAQAMGLDPDFGDHVISLILDKAHDIEDAIIGSA